jgi:cyclase
VFFAFFVVAFLESVTMNRRDFVISTAMGVAGVGLAGTRSWAQAPAAQAPPVTRFEELRRGVGVFIGTGGTIGYLVNGDGAIAIDSQFMNTAEICVAGLKQRAPKGISLLFNTHHHGDHTGGNKAFAGVTKIIAHANCLKSHKAVTEEAKTVDQQAYATATFTDTWTEKFGDETIEGRYFGAGHTAGDAVYHFQRANVMHMGDLLFNRAHPNIDRAQGARVDSWITVLDRATGAASRDTIFIAGHAKNNVVRSTRADVVHFRDYLTAALDHARKGVKAGQSKEEVQKLEALKGFEDNVSPNPRLTLAFVLGLCYDEVTQK